MTPDEIEVLVEQVAGAHRPRPLGADAELRYHPAWHDLDADARRRAYERARAARPLEAALDPDGLSTTVHAVLARIVDRR